MKGDISCSSCLWQITQSRRGCNVHGHHPPYVLLVSSTCANGGGLSELSQVKRSMIQNVNYEFYNTRRFYYDLETINKLFFFTSNCEISSKRMSSAWHLHRETILGTCSGTSANPSGSPPDKSLGKHLAGSKCYATSVIFGPVNTMLYRLISIPSCWFVWGNKVSTAQCQLFCSLWVYFNRRVHDKHAHTTLWRDFSSACQLWVTRTQCPVAWYQNVDVHVYVHVQ